MTAKRQRVRPGREHVRAEQQVGLRKLRRGKVCFWQGRDIIQQDIEAAGIRRGEGDQTDDVAARFRDREGQEQTCLRPWLGPCQRGPSAEKSRCPYGDRTACEDLRLAESA